MSAVLRRADRLVQSLPRSVVHLGIAVLYGMGGLWLRFDAGARLHSLSGWLLGVGCVFGIFLWSIDTHPVLRERYRQTPGAIRGLSFFLAMSFVIFRLSVPSSATIALGVAVTMLGGVIADGVLWYVSPAFR